MKSNTIKSTIFLFFLLIFLASAFAASDDYIFKKGEQADLKILCQNDGTPCAGSSYCNISIFYPNSTIYVDNQQMQANAFYHNYTLPNSSILGTYEAITYCSDGSLSGSQGFSFLINKIGEQETGTLASIYGIAAFIVFLIMLATIFYAYNIEGDNKFGMGLEGEPLVEIAYGKYVKILLWGFAYLMAIIFFFLLWQVSQQFIIIETMERICYLIFKIMLYMSPAWLLILVVIWGFKHITDSELLRLQKRGLFPRK